MKDVAVAALEHAIEAALMPGRCIDWRSRSMFIDGLHEVEEQVEELAARDAGAAADVLESFIAGVNAKMAELDDDGDMGVVATDLYIAWIKARQASSAPAAETIRTLVWWVEHDDYGLAFEIERGGTIKALDADGLAAFAEVARAKLAAAEALTDEQRRRVLQATWDPILRSVLIAQGRVAQFAEKAERDGVTPGDCQVIAEMLTAEAKYEDALAWVTRGLALEATKRWPEDFGHDLGGLHRRLLQQVGRVDEALASAWAAYQKHPWEHSYDEVMSLVPQPERDAWHERAMAATGGADLWSVAALLVKCKEVARLAERVRALSDSELERMSYFRAEPVAGVLEEAHPDLAARLYAECGLRVVNRGKSRYYAEALVNFERARACFLRAGLASTWDALVDEVRAAHSRKPSFMPAFVRLVAGQKRAPEPSFLERARNKYSPGVD